MPNNLKIRVSQSGEQRDVHAIKCIRKSGLNRSSVENLLVEIEILKQIDHPNIVKMVDFQVSTHFLDLSYSTLRLY